MYKKLREKIKNIFLKNFLKKLYYKKICLIGHSHLINFRTQYKNIKKINELDYQIFSQNGEDGIIDYLLYQLKIEKPKFVEIGVGDYSESNTRFIYEIYNSKGLIIDCNQNLEKKVKKNIVFWKGDLTIKEEFVENENINSVLSEYNFNENLDLFSLDIDGVDYWVLKELPVKFSKIAIIEYNANFGPTLEISVPNLKNFNRTEYHYSNLCFGASLRAIINLMKSKGFKFIGVNKNCINAFFINEDFMQDINLEAVNEHNLENFTNSNYRESRSFEGKLTFLSGKNKINEIRDCDVINLANSSSEKIKIKDLL